MFKSLIVFMVVVNVFAADNIKEIQDLKREVEMLTKRVDSYDKPKGILELENYETVLSVGGRIQLKSILGRPEGSFKAGKIPLESRGENGQLSMNADDSRLWFKTRTPTEYGPIRTLVEFDFANSDNEDTESTTNAHTPRLRHVYAEIAGFTIGQTNSAFNSFVTLDTIEDIINDTAVRQPLIRYSIESRVVAYDISVELPETTLLDSNGTIVTPKDDVVPDVILRTRYYPNWGEASLAFLGRYINQDNYENTNSRDSSYAWGVNTSAKIKVQGLDDIRLDAQYGLGLGRYIADNAYSAGYMDADGNIELQETFGGHLGYRHWWNNKLRSTFGLSYVGTKNKIGGINLSQRDRVNKAAYSSQINILWIPISNALVGAEYSKAIREVESGEKGDLDLITFLFRYDF